MISMILAPIQRLSVALCVVLVLALLPRPGLAAGDDAGEAQEADPELSGSVVKTTGLPVPRFVSLRSDKVNLRTGPGAHYPVEWVFTRKSMPVEITAEFDIWRRIRDWQGIEGWVHQRLLSGKRTLLITGEVRPLRAEPRLQAPAVARAEPGVIAEVKKCESEWCEVEADGYRGWLLRTDAWGVYEHEHID